MIPRSPANRLLEGNLGTSAEECPMLKWKMEDHQPRGEGVAEPLLVIIEANVMPFQEFAKMSRVRDEVRILSTSG